MRHIRPVRSLVAILVRLVGWVPVPTPRRRVIPGAIGLTVAGVLLALPRFGWMGEATANRLTLILAAVGFAFKAAEYYAMRRRMVRSAPREKLSVFGLSLIDWFTALIVFALTFVVLFTVSYYYAYEHGTPPPISVSIVTRALLNGAIAFVLASGAAAWFEMQRAGDRLAVHRPWDGDTERRRYGRRASDRRPAFCPVCGEAIGPDATP